MTRMRQYGHLALAFLWLWSLAGTTAWAQRRSQPAAPAKVKPESPEEIKRPDPAASRADPAATAEVLNPGSFLSRAKEQEEGGDVGGSLKTLTTFINLYPQHPERAAALFQAARLAQKDGQIAKAREIYALAALLYPNTVVASRSRLEMAVLEFYERLGEMEPIPAFKGFLEKIAGWPTPPPADSLREPLQAGWQAVERQVRAHRPCPLEMVEEVLGLWELQPPTAGPPEATLLLAELCREKGLWQKAETLLQELKAKGPDRLRQQAEIGLGELAGVSAGLLNPSGSASINPDRGAPLRLALAEESPSPSPGKAWTAADGLSSLSWTARQNQDVPPDSDAVQSLEDLLQQPLPGAVKEKLLRQLAQSHWSRADFSRAAKIYQVLLAQAPAGDIAAFYQDRLGLSHLKDQRLESAQEVYQRMGKDGDHFWQVLAHTRLLDLEIARLRAAPSP